MLRTSPCRRPPRTRTSGWARRAGAAVVGAGAVVLLLASPAGAHAVIDSHSAVPVSTDQTLNMYVPHELEDTVYNKEIKIQIPGGWTNPTCVPKPSWTCAIDGGSVIHFRKTDSSLFVDNENFPFTIRAAATVGTFAFPTIQLYSNGSESAWIGGGGEPAPTIRTVPDGTTPTSGPPPTPPPHSTPAPTAPPAPSPDPGGAAPSGGQPTTSTPGGAPTTTVPATTTSTAAVTPEGGGGTDGTAPTTTAGRSSSGTVASGRNPAIDASEDEIAAGLAASDEDGSSVPVIAAGVVAASLLGLGGFLAIRHQAPATAAGARPASGSAGATPDDIEVAETDGPTEP